MIQQQISEYSISDLETSKFTAILAKNDIARQLRNTIHSGESISVPVIEECLKQIEEYIGIGNQPSVEDIINSKQNI